MPNSRRNAIGLDSQSYERALSDLDASARRALAVASFGSLVPGDSVVIEAPDGAVEVDGVPCGTRGVFEGVVTLDGLSTRAAVSLDDNGELVFVRPDVLTPG